MIIPIIRAMKFCAALFVLLFLFSCGNMDKHSIEYRFKNLRLDADPNAFFPSLGKDTLNLMVMIDDCGEFGGPQDDYQLYLDSEQHYHLDYKRYKCDCDSIHNYRPFEKRQPFETGKNLTLKDKDKKAIKRFLGELMKAKMTEEIYSNTGSLYHVYSKKKHSIDLYIYTQNKQTEKEYAVFKKKLGLPVGTKAE